MKTFLTVTMFALAAAPSAYADTREDVMAAMRRCAIIQDDRTWLDCTYGAQQMMRARLGLPPAPEFQQRLVPPASVPLPSVAAAATAAQRQAVAPPQSASGLGFSTLARVQYDQQGAFVVTLDNGQVWRQANAIDGRKAPLRAGTRVRITPGSLWTHNLKADNDPHYYKVEQRS